MRVLLRGALHAPERSLARHEVVLQDWSLTISRPLTRHLIAHSGFQPHNARHRIIQSTILAEPSMSIGTILLIILVIALLGGFSGIGGGRFYGGGPYVGGGIGLILVIVLILVLLGRL